MTTTMDLDNATTEQSLETILDIMENQEEGLALIGKQEWMESCVLCKGSGKTNNEINF
jgi:hypothetical protein